MSVRLQDRLSPIEPAAERPWLTPFVPHRWWRGGHLQTIAGNFASRRIALPAPQQLAVPVPDDPVAEAAGYPPARLVSLCHWQPEQVRRHRLTVLLLHGLEGSAHSGYMLRNAARLWARGANVVRMNMRSCGEGETLAASIYHSGRSEDVSVTVQALRAQGAARIAVVGYSLGANLVLKYAGEQPGSGLEAVVGVSPLMDLAPSSAALHLPSNRVYERRFLRAMKRRLRRKAVLFPRTYGGLEGEGVFRRIRSMRDFDGEIVARFGGFADADDYYEQVRSSRYAATLPARTLLLHASDDPFVRMLSQTRDALLANANVALIETPQGGHCAFLSNEPHDPHWAERTVEHFLLGPPR